MTNMDEIKKVEKKFLEMKPAMEVEHKKWVALNEKHRLEHKDDWVFERMERVYEMESRWGGQRGAQFN